MTLAPVMARSGLAGVFRLLLLRGKPTITRKTDKGLSKYQDSVESDVFILSGAEDLVPALVQNPAGKWVPEVVPDRTVVRLGRHLAREAHGS